MGLTREERIGLLYDLQVLLIDAATYGTPKTGAEYKQMREQLLKDPVLAGSLPIWLKSHRDLQHFRTTSQTKGGYAERREFVRLGLEEAFAVAERESTPTAAETEAALSKLSSDEVERVWRLALTRKDRDPDGALTLARTLLETVVKHILDDDGVPYDKSASLPALYKTLSEHLNLAPAHHDREAFKAILGAIATIVTRLGELRNSYGDSHGKGRKATRISPRHAGLAVNLAGSIAGFIVETWNNRRTPTADRIGK